MRLGRPLMYGARLLSLVLILESRYARSDFIVGTKVVGIDVADGTEHRQLYSLDALFQPPDDVESIDQAADLLRTKLDTTPRIVGGIPVEANPSYGFSAGAKLCGGTLIHPDILLTAAHCAGNFVDGLLMGGIALDGSTSTFFPVTTELPHPDYDTTSEDNDIMLVKISSPVSAPLQPVNFDPAEPPVGSTVSVIGYGATSEGGTSSPVLLETENTVLSFADCNAYYNTISETRMICMGDAAGGRDSCQGDSGGPMLINGVQVGIVSFGDGCARPNVPSVFARTSGFETWIKNGICDLSSEPPASCDAAETTAPVGPPTAQTPTMAPAATETPVSAETASPAEGPVSAAPIPTEPTFAPDAVTSVPTRTPVLQADEEPTVQPIMTPAQVPSPIQVPLATPIGTPPAMTPIVPPVPVAVVGSPKRPPVNSPASKAPKVSRPTAVVSPPAPSPTSKGMGMGKGMGKNMGMGNVETLNPTAGPTPTAIPIMDPTADISSPTVLPTTDLFEPIPPSPMPTRRNGTGKGGGMGKRGENGGKSMGKGMGKRNDDDDCDDDANDRPVSSDTYTRIEPLQTNGKRMTGRMKGVNARNIFSRFPSDSSDQDSGSMRMKQNMPTSDRGSMKRARGMRMKQAAASRANDGSMGGGRRRRPYSVWRLIAGNGDKDSDSKDEDNQTYIRPLPSRQRPHVKLEQWFRNHVTKKFGNRTTV